jgi:acetyl esterase/lipase
LLVLEGDTRPERPLAPFFAPCGSWDPLLEDTLRLQRVLGRLGVACEAPIFEHELHAFHAFVFSKAARRCWAQAFDFLRSYTGAGDILTGTPDFAASGI